MFYLNTVCCAAIRRNKEWMNKWITRIIVLDWIGFYYVETAVLWTVCWSVCCMLQLNGDKTKKLLWFSSATHLQWSDPSRWTTVSSSQWPSFMIWACGWTQSCPCANMYFHLCHQPQQNVRFLCYKIDEHRQLGRDVSARLVSAHLLPGLLQRCSCRSSSGNIGTTAESITSHLDAVLLDCCFSTSCVTQV